MALQSSMESIHQLLWSVLLAGPVAALVVFCTRLYKHRMLVQDLRRRGLVSKLPSEHLLRYFCSVAEIVLPARCTKSQFLVWPPSLS